jgi:hypothetical protein
METPADSAGGSGRPALKNFLPATNAAPRSAIVVPRFPCHWSPVDQNSQPSDERAEKASGSGCSWPAAVALIAIVGLIVLLVLFLFKGTVGAPGTIARDMQAAAAKLGNLFGTDVKVDNQSVTLESREIMELATVQHRIVCVSKYTTTWAGSTATIIVRGAYTAKAGFSLDKATTFRLDDNGHIIDSTVPPAKILSVTTEKQEIFHAAQGLLKILEPKDYEEAYRQNREQAMREAAEMGMREEARARLKERVQDMLPLPVEKPGPPVLRAPSE